MQRTLYSYKGERVRWIFLFLFLFTVDHTCAGLQNKQKKKTQSGQNFLLAVPQRVEKGQSLIWYDYFW